LRHALTIVAAYSRCLPGTTRKARSASIRGSMPGQWPGAPGAPARATAKVAASWSCMMRGAAPFGAHCGSHCHIAWRLPIFASSRSLSRPDASPFFAARLDTALDALCGSVCRLSFSDNAPPPHAAFPHVPTAHRAGSTGCHDRSGGR